MAEFVEDCPRCRTKSVTFTIPSDYSAAPTRPDGIIEAFMICRNCLKANIGIFTTIPNSIISSDVRVTGKLSGGNGKVSSYYQFDGFVTPAFNATMNIPEHLPDNVAKCFSEGAAAFAIGAHNAAAAMFRLSLDLATKNLLPETETDQGGPNRAQRTKLYDRLEYLFSKSIISPELRDLADCIREDGNDGAHDGTLSPADAEDLVDFAEQLLERVYTEPARLRIAKARREARRAGG